MLKVKLVNYDELPEDIKKDYSRHCEDSCFLLIYYRNKLLFVESDAMEPEDARFCRDLSWIPEQIEKAYKLGLKDGNSLDYIE